MQYKEDTDQLSIENDNLKQKLELYICAQAQDRTAYHQQEAMVTIINNWMFVYSPLYFLYTSHQRAPQNLMMMVVHNCQLQLMT